MRSAQRKDTKGRILRTGEQQRKDGSYLYTYKGIDGKNHFVYSRKLLPTDVTNTRTKNCKSLRELEQEIQDAINNELNYNCGRVTVLELVQRYIGTKTGVRHNTMAGYKTVLNLLKREAFGTKIIGDIKVSDAKLWIIKLQSEDKKSYSSIHSIRGVLRPAFQMALEDDMIKRNPFEWELSKVLINDSATREALTQKQEKLFLDFIKNDTHYSQYYDGIYILFKTGLRISEFCGLTLDDVDMVNRKIRVDHQLQRTRDGIYMIVDTKTTYGERELPMSKEVYDCFKRIIEKRKRVKHEPMVDGKSGFLILDRNGMPYIALHWEKRFQYALGKYNRTYKEELPTITPHVCRHTYCTNMAKSGISAKALQYLMGHSDISTTLNVYTHLKYDDVLKELTKLEDEQYKV